MTVAFKRATPARTDHVVLKLSRAVMLMNVLLRNKAFTEDQLEVELVVPPGTIARYRAGEEPMPLDRQMCLALLMMSVSARYARPGIQLRDQVRAALRFARRDHETQQTPPRSWVSLRTLRLP